MKNKDIFAEIYKTFREKLAILSGKFVVSARFCKKNFEKKNYEAFFMLLCFPEKIFLHQTKTFFAKTLFFSKQTDYHTKYLDGFFHMLKVKNTGYMPYVVRY